MSPVNTASGPCAQWSVEGSRRNLQAVELLAADSVTVVSLKVNEQGIVEYELHPDINPSPARLQVSACRVDAGAESTLEAQLRALSSNATALLRRYVSAVSVLDRTPAVLSVSVGAPLAVAALFPAVASAPSASSAGFSLTVVIVAAASAAGLVCLVFTLYLVLRRHRKRRRKLQQQMPPHATNASINADWTSSSPGVLNLRRSMDGVTGSSVMTYSRTPSMANRGSRVRALFGVATTLPEKPAAVHPVSPSTARAARQTAPTGVSGDFSCSNPLQMHGDRRGIVATPSGPGQPVRVGAAALLGSVHKSVAPDAASPTALRRDPSRGSSRADAPATLDVVNPLACAGTAAVGAPGHTPPGRAAPGAVLLLRSQGYYASSGATLPSRRART